MSERDSGLRLPVAGLSLMTALLVGCASATAPGYTTGSGQSQVDQSMKTPDSRRSAAAAEARRLLATRLDVDVETVQVVEETEVIWPDTSLGCPKPGMAYAQRLVNGSRIVLEAQGRSFHYHTGPGRGPFYCENPQPPADAGGHGDI